mmetsp:Transcript_8451/g.20770  ORF Transcript_8451/g.20770 Transcript_8451/m.20770 type:complete len:235 (+) Transcript_8451:1189-1893(+)
MRHQRLQIGAPISSPKATATATHQRMYPVHLRRINKDIPATLDTTQPLTWAAPSNPRRTRHHSSPLILNKVHPTRGVLQFTQPLVWLRHQAIHRRCKQDILRNRLNSQDLLMDSLNSLNSHLPVSLLCLISFPSSTSNSLNSLIFKTNNLRSIPLNPDINTADAPNLGGEFEWLWALIEFIASPDYADVCYNRVSSASSVAIRSGWPHDDRKTPIVEIFFHRSADVLRAHKCRH